MSRYDNTKRNQYNSTPRKVFDTYIDRMAIKRERDREDHRADMQALIKRLSNLEELFLKNVILSKDECSTANTNPCHDISCKQHGTEGLE